MKVSTHLLVLGIAGLILSCQIPQRQINQVSASPCKVIFGRAQSQAKGKKGCEVNLQASMDPALVSIPLEKAFTEKDLIEFDFQFSSSQDLKAVEFRLYANNDIDKFVAYKPVFFAQESFNFLQSGMKNKLTLSLAHFIGEVQAKKLDTLGLFVQPKSGKAFSITLSDLRVSQKNHIGKGFVSITFDDGYESLKRADELLAQNSLSATAYIIFEALNQKGYISKQEACRLSSRGWAISSHATVPFTQKKDLASFIETDLKDMAHLCKDKLQFEHLAYPLGEYNSDVLQLVKKKYQTARLAAGGLETLPPADWHKLRVLNVTPQVSPQEIIRQSEAAVKSGDWLILMFHYLVEGKEKNDLEYSMSKFRTLVDGLKGRPVNVKTVPDVYNYLHKN